MILPFFIGTYTSPGGSEGIYQSTLNLETGELTQPALAAKTQNPSYLALNPGQTALYCVNETSNGGVTGFTLTSDHKLTNPAETKITGGGPCFLSFNPLGTQIFTASYGTGDFNAFNPGRPVFWHHNNNASEGEDSHAHSIKVHPTLPFAYAADLGRSQILIWTIRDAEPQRLQVLNFRVGSPRHMAFSKTGKTLYVNSEHNSSVTALHIDSSTGALTEFQTMPTLPEGSNIKNSTAEILLHPSGEYLYVTNRGHNSIATFRIRDEILGEPTITSIETETPRGLAIDPTGTYLLAAGQSNDIIISLKINPITGIPSPTGHKITLSKPVHMLFAPPKG